jgi:hypothetical protein
MKRLLALSVLAVALVGCGEESTGEKVFGKLTDNDQEAFEQLSHTGFLSSYAAWLRADTRGNPAALRRAQDRMLGAINRAHEVVVEFDNENLRKFFGGYADKLSRLGAATERYTAYVESGGPREPAREDRILTDLQRVGERVRRADRELVDRILAEASPEQREKLRKGVRRIYEQQRDASGLK